jgi:4-nitrophenyl phosphatase
VQLPASLSSFLVYVFDLDGVLYRGDDAVEDAPEAIAALREAGKQLFFLTNNSSQPRRVYVEKLTRLGMPCTEDEIVTSSSATADYLQQRGVKDARILAVGGPGIADELGRVGLTVEYASEPFPDHSRAYDYVIAGIDWHFDYHRLNRAMQAIRGGATFIATNRDAQYPMEGGMFVPGGGAIVAAIATASGVEPITMGKPEPTGLQTILTRAGVWAHEALMVGDRLDTDIACGNRLGVPTLLVRTGISTEADAQSAPDALRPTYSAATLKGLINEPLG